MKSLNQLPGKTVKQWITIMALGVILTLSTTACSMVRMIVGTGAVPPAQSEFGMGPRASQAKLYTATLISTQPLKKGQLLSIKVNVVDADGKNVDAATIGIDGGMPQHGHGLPTRPRVTRQLGNGIYQIEGVRFSMGGWWEFKLAITSPAGTDTVTFNLSL